MVNISIQQNITTSKVKFIAPKFALNNTKFNHGQLAVDTVTFTGKNKQTNQREYSLLNIDPQKYQPFPSQIREGEKNRRELQLLANTLGIKIELPDQEEYAEALHTELELQRADNKIKQAKFQYNKAKDYGNSKEEINQAYENISIAEVKAQEIKNNIPENKKQKSEKTISQYKEAEQKINNTIKDIKINTLIEVLGEDIEDIIDKEKIQRLPNYSSHYNSFSNFENVQYLEALIGVTIITKNLGKNPKNIKNEDLQAWSDSKSQKELQDQVFKIANKYAILVEARCAGVKAKNPSEKEIIKAHENYSKALLELHVTNKNRYLYD